MRSRHGLTESEPHRPNLRQSEPKLSRPSKLTQPGPKLSNSSIKRQPEAMISNPPDSTLQEFTESDSNSLNSMAKGDRQEHINFTVSGGDTLKIYMDLSRFKVTHPSRFE
jgi:hypothetical protein